MRWLHDELGDPDGLKPYKEGDVWLCRNCAAEMPKRRTLCGPCIATRKRQRRRRRGEDKGYHRL